MSGPRIYVGHEYWERALRPWLGCTVIVEFAAARGTERADGVLTGLAKEGPELDSRLVCRWEDLVSVEEVPFVQPRTHAEEVGRG